MIPAFAVISICYIVFLSALPAVAEPETDNLRYISDMLVINLRDQLEKPYSVVGVVRSGDPVRILEEQDNYYKVETEENKQGWIGKQYLSKEIPGALVVQQLRREIAELKYREQVSPGGQQEERTRSTESCTEIEQQLDNAQKMVARLQNEQKLTSVALSSETKQDPELAAQLEQTSLRYNQLVIEYENRGKRIAELQNALAKQDDTTRFLWFGAGAVVFFLGLLAGRSASRKKNKFLY